jgi:hypothetical protein
VNRAVPTNPVGDPTGDAQSPHYVPAGPGPNLPKFDFTQLRLSRPNAATLRVQMTLNNLSDPATPAGKTNSLWLTRFQALSRGDEGEEAYRIFYVGMEKVGNGAPSFFAGSGDSNNNGVPGDGCVNTTPENCKIVEYPAEQVVTGSVSGNTITIDVPIQGGFGSTVAARPILSNTLYNVTALSAGRNGSPTNPVDIHADLDATKAFDYPLTSGGNPPPPPPPPHCDNDTGHHDHGAGEFDDHGHHGQFSMNACDRGHEDREKVHYKEDGGSNDFRSTRTDSITHSGNTATITGAGIHAGQQVTFTVTAVNNGTTGDVFSLTLSDGFARSGTLTSGDIKGS